MNLKEKAIALHCKISNKKCDDCGNDLPSDDRKWCVNHKKNIICEDCWEKLEKTLDR